jgi:hypothetical protein
VLEVRWWVCNPTYGLVRFFGNGHYFRGLLGCRVNRSRQNSVENMSNNTQYLHAIQPDCIWFDLMKSVEYLQIKGVTKSKFVSTRIFSTLLLLLAPFCVDVKNEFSWSGAKLTCFHSHILCSNRIQVHSQSLRREIRVEISFNAGFKALSSFHSVRLNFHI